MDNWIKKDLKYIWHPYTQMKDCFKLPPILIERAKGIKLYDNRGNFYYDTISSWWCNVHGHNHPKIKEAIKKQLKSLEHILFAGFTHRPAIELTEKLIGLAPKNLTKVFFSDNGSTAVEIALKMSFQYWQNIRRKKKTRFISLDYAYHGDTIGAMGVSGKSLFNQPFLPLLLPSFKVPAPYCYRCPMGRNRNECNTDCIEPLKELLKKKSHLVAGIILEPLVLAAGGMIVYPKEYLVRVMELAKRFNVHLIFDEVATGFGRTGRMFAADNFSEGPDFMCLAKGITSGYLPLAATLTTERIYQAFYADYEKKKTFYHGHTYTANPISCACALESLKIFEEEKILKRIGEIIPIFYNLLERFRELTLVGDVRYIGLIGAMELVEDKTTKKSFAFKERIGFEVYKRALKKNLILRPLGNVIYLLPPLCIKQDELRDIIDRTYSVIKFLCFVFLFL